jgi:hypothetical protein
VLGAFEHLGDELVARQAEKQVLGVVVPALAAAQPQALEPAIRSGVEAFLILRFARLQAVSLSLVLAAEILARL